MHSFTSTVHISGQPRQMRVSYSADNLTPELKETCVCLETGDIFLVDNWEEQFMREASADMFGKAAGQELYVLEDKT